MFVNPTPGKKIVVTNYNKGVVLGNCILKPYILDFLYTQHMVDPDLSLEEAVSQFMLHWASTINIILREFTISAVQSFG